MEDDSTSDNDAVSQLEEAQKTLQFVMQELDNALKSNEKLRTKIYKLKNRMRLPPFRKSPAEEKALLAQMSKPRPRPSFESSPLPPRLREKRKLRNSIAKNLIIDQTNSTSESTPTKKRKRIRKLKDTEKEEEDEDPFADLREPLPCLPAEVWCYIFSYCPLGDVFRSISFVSQEFRSFSLSSVREIRIHNRDYNHEGALHMLLQSMQSCFPSLKALDISWCNKIRDEDLLYLPEELHRLSLRACARVTDKALRKLPPTLRTLDLSLCVKISDDGLLQLPSGLRSLSLASCWITDKGIESLALQLTMLETLDLSKTRITSKALPLLPATLTSLDLSSIPGMPIVDIAVFAETRPRCSVLHGHPIPLAFHLIHPG